MAYYRLNENHPMQQALDELFSKMEELDLRIDIGAYGRVSITHKNETVDMLDIEAPIESDRYPIETFPPLMEYKLVYKKESECHTDQQ